ncbi:Serine/threonine-protein kinase CTR1 [Pelomyxa schiedti]|nr:Serine/threonine-protein kinase CTR1 [Pelomyxa schiedti]
MKVASSSSLSIQRGDGGGSDRRPAAPESNYDDGSSSTVNLADLYYNYFLISTYVMLLALCGGAFVHGLKMVGRRGLGLPAASLFFVAFTCVLRLVSYAPIYNSGFGDSAFGVVSHLAACSCYSAVWCIALGIYVKFHPHHRAVNKGGVPWKWRYISLGVNAFTYLLVMIIALVTANLEKNALSHSGSSNSYCVCSDPVDVLDDTLLLVVAIAFFIVAFVIYQITHECYHELIEKAPKILLVVLVVIGIGCCYRALNDVVTVVWPGSPLSGEENNYSSLAKEVIPAYAIVVAVIILHQQKPCAPLSLYFEPEDIKKDPAVKEVILHDENLTMIGSGSYGTVFSATIDDDKGRKHRVAVKFPKSLPAVEELLCLGRLWHPNIINLWGWTESPKHGMGIVLDLAAKGNLQKVLDTVSSVLSKRIRVRMALDIANGMKFVHSMNLLHRDLKPGNILVDDSDSCKICDFGTAVDSQNSSSSTTIVGTHGYMAPECLNGAGYAKPCDVFSYAIVLWVLLHHGEHPFGEELKGLPPEAHAHFLDEATKQGNRPPLPKQDTDLCPLLERCWAQNPAARPSFSEIVRILTSYCARKPHSQPTNGPVSSPQHTTPCEAQKPERNLVFAGLCELGDDHPYPAPKAEDDEDCCSFSSPTVTDPSVSVRQTTVPVVSVRLPVKILDYGSINNTTPSKNKNRD